MRIIIFVLAFVVTASVVGWAFDASGIPWTAPGSMVMDRPVWIAIIVAAIFGLSPAPKWLR